VLVTVSVASFVDVRVRGHHQHRCHITSFTVRVKLFVVAKVLRIHGVGIVVR